MIANGAIKVVVETSADSVKCCDLSTWTVASFVI